MRLLGMLAVCALLTASAPAAEFVPSNPAEMKPLAGRDTPACRAASHFLRGANLGNFLEVPPGQDWGGHYTPADLKQIRAEGFDHVRLPVGWHHYAGPGPEFQLSPGIFAKVDLLVTNAVREHLAVMINIHHFDDFTTAPAAHTEKFLALWRQIAAHYAAAPATVAFELLNEPKDNATTAVMNPIYARALAEIRKTNPHRTVFAGPGRWNDISELKNLVLPPDDNLIVTLHCYAPYYFTYQGAEWTLPETQVTGIQFPGPPATPLKVDEKMQIPSWVRAWLQGYNSAQTNNPCSPHAFASDLHLLRQWSDYYGRPVHLGEFGCFIRVEPGSRARYYAAMRAALEKEKIGWAIWNWGANFAYWDKKNQQPLPGLHEALFGKDKDAQ